MHTSKEFGFSYKLIENEGFEVNEKLNTLKDDSKLGVVLSMSETIKSFANIWDKYQDKIDMVLVLGDRFEMFAATSSVIPYNIPIAHFHGGETTLGAIDNKFRNAITAMVDYHFTSNKIHAERVKEIIKTDKNIFNVGALGLDNIYEIELYSSNNFSKEFNYDITKPYILMTFQPETISLNNKLKIETIINTLKQIPQRVLCTLPNADTESTIIRSELINYEREFPSKIKCFENLGQKGYLTAMKHATFLLGNTSSGIIEAASFNKPVLNLGDRQKGRLSIDNVITVDICENDIFEGIKKIEKKIGHKFINPYGDGKAALKVIDILEKISNEKGISNRS